MCLQIVEDAWNNTSLSFYDKLSLCAEILSAWGKEITGSFKSRTQRSKKILKALKGRRDKHSIKFFQEEKKNLAKIYSQ